MSTSNWSSSNSLSTKASYVPTGETAILSPTPGGSFGNSVDMSTDGNYLIVEATAERYAYIFTRSGSTWSYGASVYASDGTTNDNSGKSVAFSGNGTIAAVGDPSKNSNIGKVYIYT